MPAMDRVWKRIPRSSKAKENIPAASVEDISAYQASPDDLFTQELPYSDPSHNNPSAASNL
jgi:hypothetical protein